MPSIGQGRWFSGESQRNDETGGRGREPTDTAGSKMAPAAVAAVGLPRHARRPGRHGPGRQYDLCGLQRQSGLETIDFEFDFIHFYFIYIYFAVYQHFSIYEFNFDKLNIFFD